VGRAISLPARFILIAAMNPCPCGMLSEGANRCRCSTEKKAQYRKKLSTPILDRMALMVKLSSVVDFHNEEVCENLNYKNVCDSIENAYQIQAQRFRGNKELIGNGQCEVPREFRGFDLTVDQEEWMKSRQKEWTLSFRRVNQVIKVARTIADLEGAQRIEFEHLKEAWGLRCFDFYQMS
jgi:magnesium chelatase family protein